MEGYNILIVEDDNSIASSLKGILEAEGAKITVDNDGTLAQTDYDQYHLILMDIMLPNEDGIIISKRIAQKMDIPIIFITAKGDTDTKVAGLKLGKDYVEKPFDPLEIIERINNAIVSQYGPRLFKVKHIFIEQNAMKVYSQKHIEIKLTKTERDLFFYLFKNKNIILTKDQIMDEIWPYGITFDTVLNVYINKLREKLEDYDGEIICNLYGVGYQIKTGR